MILGIGLWTFLRALFTGAASVALQNLALRHQLLVLQRSVGRPRLARWDRTFWVWLSRVWAGWRLSLVIVQPAIWSWPGTAKVSSSTGGGSPSATRLGARGSTPRFAS